MVFTPSSPSPAPGVPGIPANTPAREELSPQSQTKTKGVADPMTIFSTLQAAIAAKDYDPLVVLGAIAESAQALTGANSAALAMRRDGLVICRARSGEMAPEVGSRLSVDSGISGECLRTGRVLRCDDTQKDHRVDPEVCLRLGLRSIAIVPLRGHRGTMGVLEAFSTRPYAFAEEHMQFLGRLADLAEAARVRESGVREKPVDSDSFAVGALNFPPTKRRDAARNLLLRAKEGLVDAKEAIVVQVRDHLDLRTVQLILAALTVPLFALLGFSVWNAWHKIPAEAVAKASLAQPASAATPPPANGAQADLVWKPSPVHVATGRPAVNPGIEAASRKEIEPPLTPPPSAPANESKTEIAETTSPSPLASAVPPALMEAPKLEGIAPDNTRLASLASIPVDAARFGSPVSQGLSGGVLEHRVQPTYPLQALPLRLKGTVVLQATIGEKGKVDDLKVVSGPPLLTAAAMDAVRQWRYSPFLLNGKPVKMQKEITISFQAP